MYSHDEADITIISYLLEAVKNGKNIVRVISDDTDVCVLLVYWVWRLQMTAHVQLYRWCGAILNINESSAPWCEIPPIEWAANCVLTLKVLSPPTTLASILYAVNRVNHQQ